MKMRETHREITRDEGGRRLESMLRRFGSITRQYAARPRRNARRSPPHHQPPPLRRDPQLRPSIPSYVLADLLEGSIAQDTLIREVVAEADELKELESDDWQKR